MKLRVLGCSGGIGGRFQRTTAFLLDQDILIDAGTGVGDLSIAELMLVDHVFITHSHLDHILSLPLLVDTVGEMRNRPVTVHALDATLEILRSHIFNWAIWPDFSEIPSSHAPVLRFEPIRVGQTVDLDGRRITAIPASHTVPAVGYHIDSGASSLVFTGDTGPNDELWRVVNRIQNLRHVIIETAFSNRERKLAVLSKHLCPDMLADELLKLEHKAQIYITHLKPGQIELTMEELGEAAAEYAPIMLQNGHLIEF